MKKHKILFVIVIFSFLFFAPSLTQAQFIKGDWLLEGSVGDITISNYTNEAEGGYTNKSGSDVFGFSVYPSAGYFIENDFVIGLAAGFDYYNNKSKSFDSDGYITIESNNSSSQISFAPFLRYYLPVNESTNLRFYGQIGGGISYNLSSSNESTSYDQSGQIIGKSKTEFPEKYFNYFIEGLIGLNYFIAENVALNGALGYNYSKSTESTKYNVTYSNGIPNFYIPAIKYTETSNNFIWNVGFTMIIP